MVDRQYLISAFTNRLIAAISSGDGENG